MMWNKQNIFEPSGCLSREAFDALRNNVLPPDVKAVATEHLTSCPFCTDAMEGLEEMGSPQITAEVVATLDDTFQQKYLSKKTKTKSIVWFSISIAASLLLLSGLFFLFRDNKPKTQFAVNTPQKSDTDSTSSGLLKPKEPQEENSPTSPVISKNEERELKAPIRSEEIKDFSTQSNDEVKAKAPEPLNKIKAEKEEDFDAKSSYAGGAPAVMMDSIALDKKSLAYISETKSSKRMDQAANNYSAERVQSSANKRSYNAPTPTPASEAIAENKKETFKDDESISSVIEEPATFQGGDINKFRIYVIQQLKIPNSVEKSNESGNKAIFQFVIDKKGKLIDIKIIRSLDPAIDNEIVKILKNSPLWAPGKQGGKPVKQKFIFPLQIHFQK
jgi:hypothetical protein